MSGPRTADEEAVAATLHAIECAHDPHHGSLKRQGHTSLAAALVARGIRPVPRRLLDTTDGAEYERRVQAMADAIHEDCRLEWQAIAVADPGRLVTQHMADAHYGQAHNLVRRIFPETS